MSSIQKIFSASLASWIRIGVTVAAQIISVPVFLHHWGSETYGIWLFVQGSVSLVTIIDVSYQNYLGYEFLKTGHQRIRRLSELFSSALPIAFISSFTCLIITLLVLNLNALPGAINMDTALFFEFKVCFLISLVTWVATSAVGGIIGRSLYPFGHYPLLAWAGTLYNIMSSIAPLIAVSAGANLITATIVASATTVLYNAGLMSILVPLARKCQLFSGKIDVRDGFSIYLKSMTLALQAGIDLFRQQGTRLVLAPLAGISSMTEFSTMRTGANFALQGLGTITGPIMPELMRFLVARDQARMEGAFALVWLVLCAVLLPAIVIVQWLMPWLFPIWTHGKIGFDPWLFGMLSMGVAVYALAQPAAAILMGNNIVRTQLAISLLAGLVAVGGMALTVPWVGIRGAALALLAAEGVSLGITVAAARRWLAGQGLRWPSHAFGVAAASVLCTALGLAALASLAPARQIPVLLATLAAQSLLTLVYWRQLPALARQRARGLIARFVPAARRPALAGATSDSKPAPKRMNLE
ncbi:MAG TPA: hypothetical protein PKD55_15390 [Bellilinea sp.]|nr:hypothetical protein [Bellilinea sp.]